MPVKPETSFWTEERQAFLLANVRQLSAGQLAKQLGTSRNAVIGKVRRLGAMLAKPDERTLAQRRTDRLQYLRDYHRRVREAQGCKYQPRRKPPPAPLFQPAAHNVTILDLDPGCCAWPLNNGPDYFFCGNPVVPGRSYCPYHAKQALDPNQRLRH